MEHTVRHTITIVAIALLGSLFPQLICANPVLRVVERIDSELLFGDVQIGQSAVEQFQLSGLQLQNNVALTITGTDSNCFSVSPKSLEPVAGALNDVTITLTYQPNAEAVQTARLEVVSPKTFPVTITLKGVGVSPSVNIDTESVATKIFARNGNVMVVTNAAQRIYLYDVLGQMLYTGITNIGENTIPVDNARMVIVKIDVKITKIVL
ncbi:MAG TPA: hypothetical protein PK557_01330 [Paludibacteraceae bacterium]|nr:hypothetical protein [Paludibacteraceae bacterium]